MNMTYVNSFTYDVLLNLGAGSGECFEFFRSFSSVSTSRNSLVETTFSLLYLMIKLLSVWKSSIRRAKIKLANVIQKIMINSMQF